jgi:hypothetical protein
MWPTLLFGPRNSGSPCHGAQSPSRRRTPLRRASGRLLVEQLEDRTVPSTIAVTGTGDDLGVLTQIAPGVFTDTTLRGAINFANATSGQDLINFAPQVQGTITLDRALGQLNIKDALTIDGPGAGLLAIDGGHDPTNPNPTGVRVFAIAAGVTAEIDDLTITHGRADNGGGILNAGGDLTLSRVVLSNNQALGASGRLANGGGVFNQGGTLTVDHSTFSDNHVRGGDGVLGSSGFGGGISGVGTDAAHAAVTTISYSTFTGNEALGGAGGGAAYGGAIADRLFSHLYVTHSIFTGNLAQGGDGGERDIAGAAWGGAISTRGIPSTVASSIFTNNQAVGGSHGRGGSGSHGSGGKFTWTYVGFASGGAISEGSGDLTVSGSVFTGNQARGGTDNTGGTADYNSVGQGAGGAFGLTYNGVGTQALPGGKATFENCTFTNNQAVGGARNQPNPDNTDTPRTSDVGTGLGGAIAHFLTDSSGAGDGSLTVINSTLAHNWAVGAAGGNGVGGGIAALFAGNVTVTNSTLAGNLALGGSGGAGGNGGNGLGGGVYIDATSQATLSGSLIVGNKATGGAGGDGGNGGNGQGGGLFNGGTAHVSESIVAGNKARGGAGGSEGGRDGQGAGGGAYNAGTADALAVLDSIFCGNSPDNLFGLYTDDGGNTIC